MRKYNIWCCVLLLSLIIFYIIYFSCQKKKLSLEPFDNEESISNDLYVKFYEKVFNQVEAYEINIKKISGFINSSSPVNILDIGTGSGKHYELLKKKYKNVKGVDKIKEFVDRAKIRNVDGDIIVGDVIDNSLYSENEFSHITCFYETIHHNTLENKYKIFQNIYKWLKPGGTLFINFMIKDKLDPAPREFSQYYHDDKKIKHSLTYFENLTHDGWWIDQTYHEQYINKDGKYFVKVHNFYIEKLEDLYIHMKNAGLKLVDVLDYNNFDISDMVLCVAKKE